MGTPALRAGFERGCAETTCAARRGARLKMYVAVVALAGRVGAARGAGCAANLATGAAEHLIFGAGYFVAARTAHGAVDTKRRLVDMAGERMCGTTGAPTGRAGAGAGDTDGTVRDGAAHAVIGAGMVPAVFGFDQAGIADARAVDRTRAEGMLAAAPMPTAGADLHTGLANEVRRALAIADLGHDATTRATGGQVMRAAERVNINAEWQ